MEAEEGDGGPAMVRGGGRAGPGAPRSLALSFSSGAAGAGGHAGPKGGGSTARRGLAAAAAAARGEGRRRRRRRRERAPRAAGATEPRRREEEEEEGRAPGEGQLSVAGGPTRLRAPLPPPPSLSSSFSSHFPASSPPPSAVAALCDAGACTPPLKGQAVVEAEGGLRECPWPQNDGYAA